MLTTAQLRQVWAPRCRGPWARVSLNGAGKVSVRPAIVEAVKALNACLIYYRYYTRAADTGAYVCLAGETSILTRDGRFPIGDLVGQEVEVLTRRASSGNGMGGPGKWVKAPIESFGEQPLRKITLGSSGRTKVIYATPEHRWFVRNGRDQRYISEVTTDGLKAADGDAGHRLLSLHPQSLASRTLPSPVGICAGLVFGDGSLNKQGAVIQLHGHKNQEFLRYFSSDQKQATYHYEQTYAEPYTQVSGLPRSWKRPPLLDEGSAHLYGWLAGYFAADGRVTTTGRAELNSTNRENLEVAQTVALRLGIATRPIHSTKREVTPPGASASVTSVLYGLTFINHTLDSSFFLDSTHRERFNTECKPKRPSAWRVLAVEETDRVEEVFCAVVPDTECFALDDFILTGNCRPIASSGNWSLHAYAIALDVNWSTNPFLRRLVTDMPKPMRDAILAIRTNNGKQVWGWGGLYDGSKDSMHWEVVCRPSDLATGINWSTVIGANGAKPTPKPKPPAAKPEPQTPENDMDIVHETDTGANILFAGFEYSNISDEEAAAWRYIGVPQANGTSAAVKKRIALFNLDKRVPRDH